MNERLLACTKTVSGEWALAKTMRFETELRLSLEDIAVRRNQIAEANARNLSSSSIYGRRPEPRRS